MTSLWNRETVLLVQLGLLLLVGRGLGELLQRWGQPAVIGQLLAGLLLGPSLFGWLWPAAHDAIFPHVESQRGDLAGLAEVGVLLLLLLTGMEVDLGLVRKVGRPALTVSLLGIAAPFACGFALGQLLPAALLPDPGRRLVASMFLGTALSISSIKIVSIVVREMNFLRRNLGQIIVASAILEDTVGWLIVAVTLGFANAGTGAGVAATLAKTTIATAVFLVVCYTVGRTLVFRLIRWVNDTFVGEYMVITAILLVMLVLAAITQVIGVNTVLGAFVAGVLVGESPILTKQIEDRLRGFITAFLMPVFFGMSGLQADLTVLRDPRLAMLTAGIVLLASLGKFAGAYAGGWLGGLSRVQALAIGCGMNARGSTEVIVATIGLSTGVLSRDLYSMVLAMAVVTTMAMPPMLRWSLRRVPLDPEEEARLRREELDAIGFVGKLERLMVVADDSANGVLASHLAGVLAGRRGQPTTVIDIRSGLAPLAERESSAKQHVVGGVKVGASTRTDEPSRDEGKAGGPAVALTARLEVGDAAGAVSAEAPKGFDLLFVGLDSMRAEKGGFSDEVDRIAAAFKGPIAMVLADRGADAVPTLRADCRILVAVNGTDASRHGTDVAFALAPSKATRVRAVHLRERSDAAPRGRVDHRRTEGAILDDVHELAERYGLTITTAVVRNATPADAILSQAADDGADFLVIGAYRRVGERLFLGATVDALLQRWQGALLVLAI